MARTYPLRSYLPTFQKHLWRQASSSTRRLSARARKSPPETGVSFSVGFRPFCERRCLSTPPGPLLGGRAGGQWKNERRHPTSSRKRHGPAPWWQGTGLRWRRLSLSAAAHRGAEKSPSCARQNTRGCYAFIRRGPKSSASGPGNGPRSLAPAPLRGGGLPVRRGAPPAASARRGAPSRLPPPSPFVGAHRDRESPRAHRYGGGSVTRILASDGSRCLRSSP